MGAKMQRGAVALLDALGFKGIWRRENGVKPAQLVAKMRRALEAARDVHEAAIELPIAEIPGHVRMHFLSDTIVAVVEPTKSSDRPSPLDEIEILCAGIAEFTEYMMIKPPELAYRGAIAFGDFLIDDPFILGPAVDEAAEAERLAEGAFVWLCPSALSQLGKDQPAGTLEYAVPMKGGQTFRTFVVPPVWIDPEVSAEQIRRGLDNAFRMPASRIDVHIKHQNTVEMVNESLRAIAMAEGREAELAAATGSSPTRRDKRNRLSSSTRARPHGRARNSGKGRKGTA